LLLVPCTGTSLARAGIWPWHGCTCSPLIGCRRDKSLRLRALIRRSGSRKTRKSKGPATYWAGGRCCLRRRTGIPAKIISRSSSPQFLKLPCAEVPKPAVAPCLRPQNSDPHTPPPFYRLPKEKRSTFFHDIIVGRFTHRNGDSLLFSSKKEKKKKRAQDISALCGHNLSFI
jgi:hypothetical protein